MEKIFLNCSKRLPIMICVDLSSYTLQCQNETSQYVEKINNSITSLIDRIKANKRLCTSSEICVMTMGANIESVSGFEFVNDIQAPYLGSIGRGVSSVYKAVLKSLEEIEKRLEWYEQVEIGYYYPIIIIISDSDNIDDVFDIEKMSSILKKHFSFQRIGENVIIPFFLFTHENKEFFKIIKREIYYIDKCYFVNCNEEKRLNGAFDKIFEGISSVRTNSARVDFFFKIQEQEIDIISEMDELLRDLSGE